MVATQSHINNFFVSFLSLQDYGEGRWGWKSIDEAIKMDLIPFERNKELSTNFFKIYDFCITGEVSLNFV